jgi:integrase
MLVADALAAFLAHVADARSSATLRAYTGRLKSLASYPLAPNVEDAASVRLLGHTDTTQLTRADLESWLSKRSLKPNGQPAAPDTIRLTIAALQQFHAWLIAEGWLSKPILPQLDKPRGRERTLLPTKAETKSLIDHAPADFAPIYRALRLTGARPDELCRATIADIEHRTGEIVLDKHKTVEKTGKPRRIAVGHPALVELLRVAIGDRTTGPIFLRSNGHAWTTNSLSATYRRARKSAGLPKGLVLYLARHEHGTELYRSTKDLKAVADALGHTQLSTSMRYTRVDSDTLKDNQRLFDEGLGDAA